MKIRVDRDALADVVAWTAKHLSPKPSLPVLSGVRIVAESGTLSDGTVGFGAFDFETSAHASVPADVMDPGTVIVSGKLLAEICKSLPGKPVDLVSDGTRVSLTCGAAKFKLLTMPVEEYPSLPAMPATSGTVDAASFAQAVGQVAIAASRDLSLPMLTAVRVEVDGGRITMLATDRYRLAMRTLEWAPSTEGMAAAAMVRSHILSEAAKTLTAGSQVGLGLTEDRIGFTAGSRTVSTLLLAGEYPKVRALFPAEFSTTAVVDVASLVEAVRRVSLVAERNTPIQLAFTSGQVDLSAGRGEDAQGEDALESSLAGEDMTAAFNPQFLLDGLGALNAGYVRFSFTAPGKPVVLSGQVMADGPDDESYRYLIMPVRLGG